MKLNHKNNTCQVNISSYKDLMKTVPIIFKEFRYIDFAIQVNGAIVTENSFNTNEIRLILILRQGQRFL